MEGLEEVVTEGGGGDDEEEGTTIAIEGLVVDKPVVLDADEAVAERGLVGSWEFAKEGFRKGVVGVIDECSVDGLKCLVCQVAGFPCVW